MNDVSFEKNELESINIKNTKMVINSKSDTIKFSTQTKRLQLFNIELTQENSLEPSKANLKINQLERVSLQYLNIKNLNIKQDVIFMDFNDCEEVTFAHVLIENIQLQRNSTLLRFSSVKRLYFFNVTLLNVDFIIDENINLIGSVINSIFIFNKIAFLSVINSNFK